MSTTPQRAIAAATLLSISTLFGCTLGASNDETAVAADVQEDRVAAGKTRVLTFFDNEHNAIAEVSLTRSAETRTWASTPIDQCPLSSACIDEDLAHAVTAQLERGGTFTEHPQDTGCIWIDLHPELLSWKLLIADFCEDNGTGQWLFDAGGWVCTGKVRMQMGARAPTHP